MEEQQLIQVIEYLRGQMIQLAMKKGNLTDEAVVKLSQLLDKYLLKYQQLKTGKKLMRVAKISA